MKRKYLGFALASLGALGGCNTTEVAGSRGNADVTDSEAALTFHRDVRPLIETHCSSCHRENGIGSFVLGYDEDEWQDGMAPWAPAVVDAVKTRMMPPWKPDPACRDYAHSRRLSDAEVAVFTDWAAAGYLEGKPGDYKAAPAGADSELGAPSLTLAPQEEYTPDAKLADDYRCFLLPTQFEQESYLIGTDITPGARRHVHHVILYTVDAGGVADAEALDAAQAGPGYACFGGPGVGRSQNVGGWVPGMVPNVTPADSARVLPVGTRLIMQVHYNTGGLAAGEEPDADKTSASLWLMPKGKVPSYRIATIPLAHTGIQIAARDENSVQTKTFSVPAGGTIVGVLPHMHTLGKSIEVVRADDDACLVRIPDWDFHWQQGYRFTDQAFLEVERGDRLKLTCVYDNSGARGHSGYDAETGEHTEPVDVRWGEGTAAEMCLNYIELRTPFARTLAQECPSYSECIAACGAGEALCIAACTGATPGCRQCTSPALGRCAVGRCEEVGLALQSCNGACGSECPAGSCKAELEAFFACMEPGLRDGSCDAVFATCGA